MASLKIPFSKTPWVSFSPLAIAGAAYVTQAAIKSILKGPNSHMGFSSQMRSSLFGLFENKGSSDQPIEASESMIFEVLGDYLMFLLISIILNVMIMLFGRVRGYFSGQLTHYEVKTCQSPREYARRVSDNGSEDFQSISEPSPSHRGNLITKLIKAGFCYTLAFCFFEIALFCAFTLYASGKIDHNPPHPYGQLRTLQQVSPTASTVKKPEKISLAMGRVLASFDVEPTIIAMSQDEKWAYVSTQNPQLIRVYDTSNFKAPVQVATVTLGDTARAKMFLELSADGRILVASNYEDVKIIDVKNPRAPQVIGSFNSPMYGTSDKTVFVSMAISQDNKYLFMAEVGFAIFDISNPSEISLVYSSVKRTPIGTGTLVTFSASRDRSLLYLATGKKALEVYNVANPSEPKTISKASFDDSTASSVILSRDEKLAYVVGISSKRVIVTPVDISDPSNIKENQKDKFLLSSSKTTPPIIQAFSPQETKLYLVQQQQLVVVDLLTKSIESNNADIIKSSLVSLDFSSSGQYAGVAYLEQIVFIELFTDYPNTKIFTSSNTSTSSFNIDHRFESWAVNNEGNALFLASNDYEMKKTAFEVWNLAKQTRTVSLNATQLGVDLKAPLLSFKMSVDNKRAYLKWWSKESSKLMILEMAGTKAPKKLKEYDIPLSLNFEDFAFSSDEKILCIASDPNFIKLYDSEGPRGEIKITSDLLTGSFDLAFAKDSTVLLVITSKISIYNVEDLSNPVFLGSVSMTEGGSPRILSVLVLEEENSLIIEWYQTARKLRIYDISDITALKLTSEFVLPKRTFTDIQDIRPEFYGPFVYSKNQKMGYVGTTGKLLNPLSAKKNFLKKNREEFFLSLTEFYLL